MPRAIADPDELRQFAYILAGVSNQLANSALAVEEGFRQLHDHWQDEKYEIFRETFDQAMREIGRFLSESAHYAQYLHRKAEYLERYLQHRY